LIVDFLPYGAVGRDFLTSGGSFVSLRRVCWVGLLFFLFFVVFFFLFLKKLRCRKQNLTRSLGRNGQGAWKNAARFLPRKMDFRARRLSRYNKAAQGHQNVAESECNVIGDVRRGGTCLDPWDGTLDRPRAGSGGDLEKQRMLCWGERGGRGCIPVHRHG